MSNSAKEFEKQKKIKPWTNCFQGEGFHFPILEILINLKMWVKSACNFGKFANFGTILGKNRIYPQNCSKIYQNWQIYQNCQIYRNCMPILPKFPNLSTFPNQPKN